MNVLAMAVLTALGIVYGDIGTSVLYAINQIFFGHFKVATTPENIYGAIGLVFWVLTLMIACKYVIFVLRADHNGEGGVFALYGLLGYKNGHSRALFLLGAGLIFAAGLLIGEVLITAAISMLSAVEGLIIATSVFEPLIIWIAIIILAILFSLQKRGTGKVGALFGPVIVIWFLSIAALGLTQIIGRPDILKAINPIYALNFISVLGLKGTLNVLGAVMLVITGGEALFADMGHIGRWPIRAGWFFIVYPALLLNYFGQGAYLLSGAEVFRGNIFYSLVPSVLLYPMIVLATFATIIASQALITGVFSLTAQAITLGLSPRLKIIHTSSSKEGQIYLPAVNWILFAGCVWLIFEFKSSANLAAAYGFSVAGTMLMTSLAMLYISVKKWGWNWFKACLIFGSFALIDLVFLLANSLKMFEGAYIPLFIGGLLFVVMTTWRWGKTLLANAFLGFGEQKNIAWLVNLKRRLSENNGILYEPSHRLVELDRARIFTVTKEIAEKSEKLPVIAGVYIREQAALPKIIHFLHIKEEHVPYVRHDKYILCDFGADVYSITARFGFMERPDMKRIIREVREEFGLDLEHAVTEIGKKELYINFRGMKILDQIRAWILKRLLPISTEAYRHLGFAGHIALSHTPVPIVIDSNGASITLPELELKDDS